MSVAVELVDQTAESVAPLPDRSHLANEIMDRIRRPFVIGMAILLTAGLGSYFALERYRTSNLNVTDSDEVIGQLDDLLSNLDRAEAAERGYIMNGGDIYSLSMPVLADTIHQDLAALRRAANEGTLAPPEVDGLTAQVEGKLKFYNQLAAIRAAQGEAAAAAMFTAGQAHDQIVDIHDRVQQMSAVQQRLLASRRAHEHLFSRLLGFIVVAGCLLAFGSIAYAGYFIDGAFQLVSSRLTEDARGREALATLNETLEQRITERSAAAAQSATDLANARRELHHQGQILQAVINFISEGVLVCDTHMRLIQTNAAAERILGEGFGRRPLDQLPQSFELICQGDERPLGPGQWPLAEAVRGQEGELKFQLRSRVDGSMRMIESVSSPVRDDKGSPRAGLAIIRDVTPLLRGERAVAELETIIKATGDAFITLARDGKVVEWNPAASRMLGYAADEISGHSCRRLISDTSIGQTREVTRRMLEGGGPERFELELVAKDGTYRPALIEAFPLHDVTDEQAAFVLICRDISDRRLLEAEAANAQARALEAARMRFEFLIGMSNEFKTSLNRINGVTPLLMESPLSAQQRDYVGAIASSSDALFETVNDILDLAGLASGKVDLDHREFDLYETIEGAAGAAAERGQGKDLELVLAMGPDLPRRVAGDQTRVTQVLTTLIDSAVRFNDHGEVVISVNCAERAAGSTSIRFELRDNGAGIPAEMQARLFQPFIASDNRTRGNGLGLAIAAQLVERMGGGAVTAGGEPGHGSVFQFTLRFDHATADGARNENRPALAGRRILVVDDNGTSRVSICGQLGLWGLAPDSAIGGAEALVAMRQRAAAGTPYDLVLTDMLMPGMDGFALARAIKSDPRLRDARLVMMGPCGVPQQPDTDEWLVKPIKPTRLFECLSRIAAGLGGGNHDSPEATKGTEPLHGYGTRPAGETVANGHSATIDHESLDHSVLDGLRSLAGDGQAMAVTSLVNTFTRALPERIAQLEMVLAAGDTAGLVAQAKSLRSLSIGLGLVRMAALCANLGANADSGDLRSGTITFAGLSAEAGKVASLLGKQSEPEQAKPQA